MKFLDLFAGIGGFRRGMELAGHECAGFCEQDKFAVASYTSIHLLTEEQRKHLETLPLKKRQKEILKEEYRNGEWYADDIRTIDIRSLPYADCWCFGFPCQDISIAGKGRGFTGNRSSLFFAVTRLIRKLEEKDRPTYLLIENVKNLLNINRGFDFARVLIELDEIGYDAEWQVLNSKDFRVPQNRERVFIIGHFRGRRSREIFPITGTGGENCIKQLIPGRQGERVYDIGGVSVNLVGQAGGLGAKTGLYAIPFFTDLAYRQGINPSSNARAIQARYNKGICNRKGETSGVAIPVLTPDRAEKRQNGRRFKENGEPMFTLIAQDRHGVAVDIRDVAIDLKSFASNTKGQAYRYGYAATLDHNCYQGIFVKVSETATIYAVWYEKYQCYIAIRKLTPKECFRLQGWTDEYFEKAAFVNSDSQLYKQAGNGVTVNVVYEIAKRMEG